jgi:eukaryotic-like serine/threonine-protein kinase
MQVECDHCRRLVSFDAERPSFCAFCGKPLPPAEVTTAPDPGATTPAAPRLVPDDLPPVVGGYRLLRVIGQGGMGTVCEAEDPASGRRVAVKLIAPRFAAAPEAVERFRREGRLASAVAHPRCVFVYAADEDAGRPYLVLELMPGETLRDLVGQRGPLLPREAVTLALDVIDGLRSGRSGWKAPSAGTGTNRY